MRGGEFTQPPEGYVKAQAAANTYHRDGRIEHENEQSLEYVDRFSSYLTARGYPPPTNILDAGCRSGYCMRALTGNYPQARITGLDIVEKTLDLAPQPHILGDICNMSFFPNEKFDWVFCCATLEHCWNVEIAVLELLRVAKIGVYIVTNLEDKLGTASHMVAISDPLEWLDVLDTPGWQPQRMEVREEGYVIEIITERRGTCEESS